MKKFEYDIEVFFDGETMQEDKLSLMGEAGWELVFIEHINDITRFYFKREIA